jgi:hypothetical protein
LTTSKLVTLRIDSLFSSPIEGGSVVVVVLLELVVEIVLAVDDVEDAVENVDEVEDVVLLDVLVVVLLYVAPGAVEEVVE